MGAGGQARLSRKELFFVVGVLKTLDRHQTPASFRRKYGWALLTQAYPADTFGCNFLEPTPPCAHILESGEAEI